LSDKAYIYWDNSNIFIPAKSAAERLEGGFARQDVRIQFGALFDLARAGRDLGCIPKSVGSIPPELQAVWEQLRGCGVDLELFERGARSGREQATDQALQVHMLRALSDVRPPQIAVLLTGDGRGYEAGVGFYADLERMAKAGWGVEVLSWDRACKHSFRDWALRVGVYIPLEDYYHSVTFIEGGRRSRPLSLIHRPRAFPKQHATPTRPVQSLV